MMRDDTQATVITIADSIMEALLLVVLTLVTLNYSLANQNVNIDSFITKTPHDSYLNFTQLARKYGRRCQEYKIITEDGYILTLFHIPGNESRPVLLMHGAWDSADTFIIRRQTSLSITLSRDRGDDVWIGNARGNKYSRRHLTLNPDKDAEYWDFSFHEIGYYDLPAMIDFILHKTGQKQLQAIGHSQGSTIFYVLGAMRPEYNDKIKIIISLAPIAFLVHLEPPISTIIKYGRVINYILLLLGQNEILSTHSDYYNLMKIICSSRFIGYALCANGIALQIDGNEEDKFEPEFFEVMVGHYPSGSSRKNALHIFQMAESKKFTQFDFGKRENLKRYNQEAPPEYRLELVSMKVALFAGRNDKICSVKEVEILKSKLPNVVGHVVMEPSNHGGFVWGKNMPENLYPHIFKFLDTY